MTDSQKVETVQGPSRKIKDLQSNNCCNRGFLRPTGSALGVRFQQIRQDKSFWAAVMAAPLFCIGLLLYQSSLLVDWSWPFNYPQKFLLLVLIYPFLEEIIFRGLLQTALHEWGMGRKLRPGLSMANVLTSILFMLSHFIYHEWQWASAILVPSLIFGHFRDKYQSITPSVALHIFYNLVYFWLFGIT